jgi:hypothetical protein
VGWAARQVRWRALAAPVAVAAGAGLGCAAILLADPTTAGGLPLPACPVRSLLGIDCPGCGGQRMIFSLLHGHLTAAAHYNAVLLAALPLILLAWAGWVRNRWQGRPSGGWAHRRWAPAVVLTVLGLWFVVRNIPLQPFTALKV